MKLCFPIAYLAPADQPERRWTGWTIQTLSRPQQSAPSAAVVELGVHYMIDFISGADGSRTHDLLNAIRKSANYKSL